MKSKWNEEMAIESINRMLITHEWLIAHITIDSDERWKDELINSREHILQAIQKLVKEVKGE